MHIEHFLAMGGYAAYVWPAYAIVAGSLLAHCFWTRNLAKRQYSVSRETLNNE